MERGGHGLPKVSLEPTMPYPSLPCGRATPEMALVPFQGWLACRVGELQPSSCPLGHPTPYAYVYTVRTENHKSSVCGGGNRAKGENLSVNRMSRRGIKKHRFAQGGASAFPILVEVKGRRNWGVHESKEV
jgi:hypothetical protein